MYGRDAPLHGDIAQAFRGMENKRILCLREGKLSAMELSISYSYRRYTVDRYAGVQPLRVSLPHSSLPLSL